MSRWFRSKEVAIWDTDREELQSRMLSTSWRSVLGLRSKVKRSQAISYLGSTGSGRVGTGQSGVGTYEAIKGRRKRESGECGGQGEGTLKAAEDTTANLSHRTNGHD